MALTEYATQSGLIVAKTELSLISGTSTLQNDTTDGTYQLFVDASDMLIGDEYRIKVYEKIHASGTKRVIYEQTLKDAQSDLFCTPFLTLMNGWDMTIQQISTRFPAVQTVATSTTTVDNTSHTVTMPSGVQAGDYLAMLFAADNSGAPTWPSGWTNQITNWVVNKVRLGLTWKVSDGSEGANEIVTTATAETMAAVVYRITGARGVAPKTGSFTWDPAAAADCPSVTPTGGNNDYLWLVSCAPDTDASAIATPPTNYSNTQIADTGSIGTSGSKLITGQRSLTAISEDPGSFTGGTDVNVTLTAAVYPDNPLFDASIRKV